MAVVELPWAAWYEDSRHRLRLPDGVHHEVLSPAGRAVLCGEEISRALAHPLGTPTLRELARGAGTVCIAVDDLTRPTRIADVLLPMLAMLAEAGVRDDDIHLVVATGSHAPLAPQEVLLKFGSRIAERYAIESHDCRGQLAGTGIRYGENELQVNARFLNSDLRVVVGSVLPHSFAGYSGGAKLVLPGLSDLESLRRSHKMVQLGRRMSSDPNQNVFRQEAEELVGRIGVHQTVCVVSDGDRRTIGVVAGEVVSAHRAASKLAADAYRTPFEGTYDAVVLNAYPKDSDLIQSPNAFIPFKGLRRPIVSEGGLIVLCSAAHKGMGEHGVFAATEGGRTPAPMRQLGGREMWLYVPSMQPEDVHRFYWEGYRVFTEERDLYVALGDRLPRGAKLAVLPCAPMQQLADKS